jgi:hypothetical protein
VLDDNDDGFGGSGSGNNDDCDLMVTGESGNDWMSMPHQHHLCRDNPFIVIPPNQCGVQGSTLDTANAAMCDNCWWVVLNS